jgi:hypothetical protein
VYPIATNFLSASSIVTSSLEGSVGVTSPLARPAGVWVENGVFSMSSVVVAALLCLFREVLSFSSACYVRQGENRTALALRGDAWYLKACLWSSPLDA